MHNEFKMPYVYLLFLSSTVHLKNKLIFIKECRLCKFKILSHTLNLFTLFYLEKRSIFKKRGFLFPPIPKCTWHHHFSSPPVCLRFSFRQNWKATWLFPLDCSIFWTGIVHATPFLKVKGRKASSLLLLLVKIKHSASARSDSKHLPPRYRQALLGTGVSSPGCAQSKGPLQSLLANGL